MDSLFAADTQNLFYSVRDLYGTGARIDFKKLKVRAKELCGDNVRCVAYLNQIKDELSSLVAALKKLGYEVRNKPIRRHGEDNSALVGSIVEAWAHYKTVCVASGDGDFIPLYDELRRQGVRVVVLSFSNALNTELLKRADQVEMLDDLVLFHPPAPVEEPLEEEAEEEVEAVEGQPTPEEVPIEEE